MFEEGYGYTGLCLKGERSVISEGFFAKIVIVLAYFGGIGIGRIGQQTYQGFVLTCDFRECF